MKRLILTLSLILTTIIIQASPHVTVVDSLTRAPLPGASIFDSSGNVIGLSDSKGQLPYIAPESFPVTVRYIGYRELTVPDVSADSLFMSEIPTILPEVLIESRQHKVLHILAYVREYSTLSTYTDTTFLFREKMVDYMIPDDRNSRFKGWLNPRVIKSRSYYRFTDYHGLDSVSNRFNQHFSWSDWFGVAVPPPVPRKLRAFSTGSDTIRGRYGVAEIWNRTGDRMTVDVDILADTSSRKWAPDLASFFRKNLEFETFRARFRYDDVTEDSLRLTDLSAYSFNVESRGRGYDMFSYRTDRPVFVNTFAEVYILDKEYITVKEARKWEKRKFNTDSIDIIEPVHAPDLQPAVLQLIARVNAIDHNDVRLDITPDYRMLAPTRRQQNIGQRALALLKQATGITYYKSHKNLNKRWDEFKKGRTKPRQDKPKANSDRVR